MSDAAYVRLRDAIIRGELHPGEKVRDSELAERLGLSRTPVREALARLADTGLIEAKPGVYTRITTLSRRDVAATLSVMRCLDELAVQTAVPRLTSRHLERMRDANKQFAHAVQELDIDSALAADNAFHTVLTEAADNPVLTRMIAQMAPQIDRILHRKFSTLLGGQDTVRHHDALIDLCTRADATAAAHLSARHWARLGDLIDDLFDSGQLTEPTV